MADPYMWRLNSTEKSQTCEIWKVQTLITWNQTRKCMSAGFNSLNVYIEQEVSWTKLFLMLLQMTEMDWMCQVEKTLVKEKQVREAKQFKVM